MAKPIGTLGTIETLTVGGRVFTSLTTLITLTAKMTGSVNATLRKAGSQSGAGYAVTAGKTLSVYAVSTTSFSAALCAFALTQSDNDTGLNVGGPVAPTNPIYFGSESSAVNDTIISQASAGLITQYSGNPMGIALAGKYVTAVNSNNVVLSIFAFGYEA